MSKTRIVFILALALNIYGFFTAKSTDKWFWVVLLIWGLLVILYAKLIISFKK